MTITLEQYVGIYANSPDWTPTRQANARDKLLPAVAQLEALMVLAGIEFPDNAHTGNGVSGETFGGFRPQDCPIGAPHSNHKEGLAVDRYDPHGLIDGWIMAHLDALESCGIWIESPSSTDGWSHWQCVAPGSGHRVFIP